MKMPTPWQDAQLTKVLAEMVEAGMLRIVGEDAQGRILYQATERGYEEAMRRDGLRP